MKNPIGIKIFLSHKDYLDFKNERHYKGDDKQPCDIVIVLFDDGTYKEICENKAIAYINKIIEICGLRV